MSARTARVIKGTLTSADVPLPEWLTANLWVALWDRDKGPDEPIVQVQAGGPRGVFRLELSESQALELSLTGHRPAPHHLLTVGWGQALDPALVYLPWPERWAERAQLDLDWGGSTAHVGFVEQIHYFEEGGLPLAVLELSGYAVPHSYRLLPPLPLPATGDRHGLHADGRLDDRPEQVIYLLAEADLPLVGVAQDALVSQLRVVAVASPGPQEGTWHEIVNVPLLLDSLTLIGP